MNTDLQSKKSYNTRSDIKEKEREEGNYVDVEHINDNIQIVDKYDDTNMLKRKLVCDETKLGKKQKKRNIIDSSINDTSYEEYVTKHKETFQEFQETNNRSKENKEYERDIDRETECLDGEYFRRNFNSTNGLDMLKKFVKICNENKERDLAAEYLNAGGNILEILKFLAAEKKGISNAITVFSALRILLIKILAQYPQYQSSAESACCHLINSHLSIIHSMLSIQSNTKQQKVVLQLFAAIVSLGGNIPRELLTHLSLPMGVVKSLVQHTKPTDNQNTRSCFIHFILAFLVEGNVSIIRTLLDKRDLFYSIFPDLIYDSKDIVALVLTTLKTYILQNPKISKTMKLQLFSTSIIQNLVCLYNWKGPNNCPKLKNRSSIPHSQHFEEKEVVTEIIHDFLILLLTSHRYGIVFHDYMLGTSHIKHNHVINTVLQSLDRPWEYEKPLDLVVKILTACPDLIKSQLTLLEPYIEPRVSLKWITAIKFVREIIQSVDMSICVKTCSLELNILQLASAVVSLILPGVILKQAIMPSLSHSNVIIRHEAVLTLTSMFHQTQKCLSISKAVYKEDNDYCTFKDCITEYMMKNVPNFNMILNVWSSAFTSNQIEDNSNDMEYIVEPKKYEHLTAVLHLLHVYIEACPKLLDTLCDMSSDTFLNTLNKLEDISVVEFNVIKVKAIQFLVIVQPYEFSPDKKIFKDALSFLISALNEETSSVTLCIKATIRTLLNATGMFEGCSDHLDIWINGFINLDDRKKVIKWFVRIVKKAAEDIEKYVNEIIKAEKIINHEVIHIGKLQDIFDELTEKSVIHKNLENNILHMQHLTSISPLLCCMLHKTKEDSHPSILSYLSYVLIHTLHYQVIPQCLIYLTKDMPILPVKEYLLSWLEGNQLVYIKNIIPTMTLLCKLNLVFLSDTKLQMNQIFNGSNIITFQYNEESITIHHSLSTYEVAYLFKMTTFYLVQHTKKSVLTKVQYDNYRCLLMSLLYIAKDSVDSVIFLEECAKSIFTHPIILHYFSPIYQKNKNIVRSMITLTVTDVCSMLNNLHKKCNTRNLFIHFKNKLLTQLCKMIDKRQKDEKIKNPDMIITLLEVLQPTPKDVVYLLKRLVKLEDTMFISNDKKSLSVHGHLISKLLEIINANEIKSERNVFFELDTEFVRDLCLHLLFLKLNSITNFEIWETALHGYLSNFSFNIGGIDADIFTSLLSTKITDTTVNLISFLIRKNIRFIPIFMECVKKSKNMEKGNIILPIVASNLNFNWDQDFLQDLRKHYETEITCYLCDPKDVKPWIEENVIAISYLIKTTFNLKICNDICNMILQTGDKLDMVSIHYIKILQSMYNKSAVLETESEKLIMNLIQIFLYIVTVTLKKESRNVQKLHILCEILRDAVKHLREKGKVFEFETLSTNHSWLQFTRFSLKFGLKGLKSDKKELPILRTLSILCDIAYKNGSNNEYVKTLFEMATSHSEFINIMLGSSETKRDLVELLWVLMQKNKEVMGSTHIPVYLAAYNATLNEADQYILFILQYYENNNVNIYEYRPYVWGNVATTYYSVKSEIQTTLWRQPSVTQVLNLFEEDIVNNTIKEYPVDRPLKDSELYRANNIYDPAFYLPLLYFLLSENNVVSCHKVAQSGALALTLAACSSKHSDVRMIAYTIITRYYTHLEASSSKTKLLWMRLIDALRYGIISQQLELNNIRINCLVSTFLARTSLIATQPLHPLYSVLQIFLVAKPALDINTIPELLQLLHSSDVEYKAHRCWILENIRDSMKTEVELDIAFKCVLFKMLLDFYISNLSDSNTKKLILEIIDATLKITKASILFIECYGILPWLLEVARSLPKRETQHFELVVKMMDKLLNTVLNMKGDIVHYKLVVLSIALSLKSHLTKDIRIEIFTLYINILQKLLLSKHMKIIVTKEQILEILEFSTKILDNIGECDDMLRFGCEYVTKIDCLEDDDEVQIARNSLRTLVWTWCIHETN
ncbi:nucleolar pre-ribosomal-associated protein 1 [Bombus flavifrons]|uniref:nucleolar pre-ribosomal-associated protein 1 n=1 Tax=Bombus flavifrons TaxID=103934 RepID=UPI00370401B8